MEHEISYYVLKIFAWGAIWAIAFEAMAANKRQGG
jgi:hypothetical protein